MAAKKKHTQQQEIAITPKKPNKREKNPHDKKRLTKRKLRDWMYGYIFLAPWIVGVILFFVMSMVDSLNYSVHKIVMDNGVQMTALEHWYDNYASVFALETDLPTTLGSFAISLVLQVPIIIAFSLIIAMLLNGKIRCRSLFRMIFFLPVIIATGPVMNMLTAQGAATVPMMSDGSLLNLLSGLPQFLLDPSPSCSTA